MSPSRLGTLALALAVGLLCPSEALQNKETYLVSYNVSDANAEGVAPESEGELPTFHELPVEEVEAAPVHNELVQSSTTTESSSSTESKGNLKSELLH